MKTFKQQMDVTQYADWYPFMYLPPNANRQVRCRWESAKKMLHAAIVNVFGTRVMLTRDPETLDTYDPELALEMECEESYDYWFRVGAYKMLQNFLPLKGAWKATLWDYVTSIAKPGDTFDYELEDDFDPFLILHTPKACRDALRLCERPNTLWLHDPAGYMSATWAYHDAELTVRIYPSYMEITIEDCTGVIFNATKKHSDTRWEIVS